MRYYVVCFSEHVGIRPHVIAEVVRDGDQDDDRNTTLASALAGANAVIASRAELLATTVGREALDAWHAGNDAQFDKESDAILADDAFEAAARSLPRLRVVGSDDDPHVRTLRVVPRSPDEQVREEPSTASRRSGAGNGSEEVHGDDA